jgi:hypothetical protein
MSILSEEIEAFHKRIRARALLMAIEWAGSAGKLAEMIGYTRFAGYKWLQRVDIPVTAARALERLPGFPVKASDLIGPVYTEPRVLRFQCPHCTKDINPPRMRTGYSSSFNDVSNRLRKQAAAKRKAARKRKPQAASAPARKRQTPA